MFKNLKISQKLYLSFGLMIFILILVTIFGVNRVNSIDMVLEEVVEVNSVKQRHAINFRGSVHDRAIAIRDVVLANSTESKLYKDSINDIKKLEGFYSKAAVKLDKIFALNKNIDKKEIQILAKIKSVEKQTLPLVNQIITYKQNSQEMLAKELLVSKASKNFSLWLEVINEFIDYQEHKNQIATPQARELASGFSSFMITILVIAMVIGILIAYFISKQLSTSATLIQNGLKSFFDFLNDQTNSSQTIKINSNDEFGNMAKMLNENILKSEQNIKHDEEFVQDVTRVIDELKTGNMLAKFQKDSNNESLKELKNLIIQLQDYLEHTIARDINQLIEVLNCYKSKDFTKRFPNPYATVAIIINELGDEISNLLKQSLDVGRTLDEASDTLLENVKVLNESTNSTAVSLEETSASLEEITASVTNNSKNVNLMTSYSKNLVQSANEGQKLAKSTSTSMEEISQEVNAINEAIMVIDQIAFQTNILSLNAAVEAATAGEAGKGFAVVAGEVRNLASRSAQAANDIKHIVETATQKANSGKNVSVEMIKGYDILLENIDKTTTTISEIASTAVEQEKGISQINDAISQVDKQTQQNAQIAAKTSEIATQSGQISKEIVSDVLEKDFVGKD